MRTLSTSFTIFQGIGLWAPANFSSIWTSLLYKLYTCFVMFVVLAYVGSGLINLMLTSQTPIAFLKGGSRLLGSMTATGKIFNVLVYRKEIFDIVETLETDPCIPRDDTETSMRSQHNRKFRNTTIQYWMFVNLTISMIVSTIILNDVPIRKLPRPAWIPYDHSHGLMYFIPCSIQILALIYLYTAIVAYDTLVCGMFLEISSKLNILGYRFLNLHETYKKISAGGKSEDITAIEKNLITDCVKYHLCLLNLAKRINSTFNYILFMQYVTSIVITCFSVYNLSFMKLNTRMLCVLFYLLNILIEIFLYCTCANEVTIESENIAESVFAMNWINFTQATWKSVIIIGCQSYRPIVFTSGYFVTMSIESFKSLIKIAYSAYNALQSLH